MISIFRILVIYFWSALMITASLILMMLTCNRKVPVVMSRTMWSLGVLYLAGVKNTSVKGVENIDKKKSYIFVSNHQSYLDIPSIVRLVPINLYFVAKKELKWMPFLGQYLWMTGMIFIDRTNKKRAIQSLDKAGKLIKKGKSILVFPEGSRSMDAKLQKFKKGFFTLAIQHQIEIVPLAVGGTHKILPSKGWNFTPNDVKVSIGISVEPPKSEKEVTKFIKLVSEQIVRMMDK